jgi:hypothetical protein
MEETTEYQIRRYQMKTMGYSQDDDVMTLMTFSVVSNA